MKKYSNKWIAKPLTINFNHKEWRQDFAAFVRKKLFWDIAMVTRAKSSSKSKYYNASECREFEIYDGYGRNIKVVFKNKNGIVSISQPGLIEEYYSLRGMLYENKEV